MTEKSLGYIARKAFCAQQQIAPLDKDANEIHWDNLWDCAANAVIAEYERRKLQVANCGGGG